VLPANYTFVAADNGVHVFSATLKTAGTQSLTATDTVTASITGTQSGINVQNPQPVITPPLSPASATAGGAAFTLTINGSNFVSGATVDFGSDKGLAPTSVTAAQIKVNIPAADIATAGTPNVVVNNPAPTVGASAPQAFTISNPTPTTSTALAGGQTHIAGGVAFTLTVGGTNFVPTSTVNFGSSPAITPATQTAGQITAMVPASDVATAGPVNVTVTNPATGGVGGGTSAPPIVFTVDGFTILGPANPVDVKAGQTASIPIIVGPSANGFANQVTFSVSGLPRGAALVPLTITPGNSSNTYQVMITTKANGAVPPTPPTRAPKWPLFRPLLGMWILALMAGLYGMGAIRKTPRLRRYAFLVPLSLLLVSGVLAGCAASMGGTPVGNSVLTVTATSGSMSQNTQVTLTVTQ